MHPIPELKLNKHTVCAIPKPRVLFARYGAAKVRNSEFTGEQTLPLHERKSETLSRINKAMNEAEASE